MKKTHNSRFKMYFIWKTMDFLKKNLNKTTTIVVKKEIDMYKLFLLLGCAFTLSLFAVDEPKEDFTDSVEKQIFCAIVKEESDDNLSKTDENQKDQIFCSAEKEESGDDQPETDELLTV